jgi:hypothetical protein
MPLSPVNAPYLRKFSAFRVATAKADALSTNDSFELLNHFLKLRAKNIHLSAHQIATQGNACHAEVSGLRTKVGDADIASRLRR